MNHLIRKKAAISYPSVTTLSLPIFEPKVLALFPKVAQLKLEKLSSTEPTYGRPRYYTFLDYEEDKKNCDADIDSVPPITSVKEVEINGSWMTDFDYAIVKQLFPALETLYINYDIGGRPETTEEDWTELEAIGKALDVKVVCRNPHLSFALFDFTALSYHEYFNSHGESPLQYFIARRSIERAREMLEKYTNAKYEQDLFNRQPHFRFPTRSYKFVRQAFQTHSNAFSDQMKDFVAEHGLIDYWESIRTCNSNRLHGLLKQLPAHMPPPLKAVRSLAHLYSANLKFDELCNLIGKDALSAWLKMKDKQGETWLHKVARKRECMPEDRQLFINESDINALNGEGKNAATIAFNSAHFRFWQFLLTNEAIVDYESYRTLSLNKFLLSTNNNLDDKALAPCKKYQEFLNKLLFSTLLLKHPERLIDKYVGLGADIHAFDDKGRTFLTAMESELSKIERTITKYQLDVNQADRQGVTPPMAARNQKNLSNIKFLIEHGADPL